MALTFVTGPVRSGKTHFAMQLARASGKNVIYVATAPAYPQDSEWTQRLRRHREERPPNWSTIETAVEPRTELPAVCAARGTADLLLVDSLGTWVADELSRLDGNRVVERGRETLRALRNAACSAVVVSEETGWGIVPQYPAGRIFRDVLGVLAAEFAHAAGAAYLVVAGYAIDLKQGVPISAPRS